MRPASIWARMSRSDSSTQATATDAAAADRRWSSLGPDRGELGTAVSFHRYVALGDSFTEGVGDPDPDRPNGLRGWADRVAEVLATHRRLRLRQPRDPRSQAPPDPRRAARAGGRPRARPGHDLRRRQRHPATEGRHRRPGREVRRRARPARRHRRPRAGVHGVRPRRLRDLPAAAWPVRALQRVRARQRRPARRERRRLLAAARLPRLALLGPGPDAPGTGRPPADGDRGARRPRRRARPPAAPVVDRGHPHPVGAATREPHLGPRDGHPLGAPPTDRPVVRRRPRPEAPDARPHRGAAAVESTRICRDPCGCSSVGRARPSQGRCREFESRHPLHSLREATLREKTRETRSRSHGRAQASRRQCRSHPSHRPSHFLRYPSRCSALGCAGIAGSPASPHWCDPSCGLDSSRDDCGQWCDLSSRLEVFRMSRARTIAIGALVLMLAATPFIPRGDDDDGAIRPAARTRPARAADRRLGRSRRRSSARSTGSSRPGRPVGLSPDAGSHLADELVRCADFDGQRYCLGSGWTDDTQAQVRAAWRRRRSPGRPPDTGTNTGDLSARRLAQAARLTPQRAPPRRPPSSPRPPARSPRSGCSATRSRACRCRPTSSPATPRSGGDRCDPATPAGPSAIAAPASPTARQRVKHWRDYPSKGKVLDTNDVSHSTAPTGAGRPRCR